MTGSSQITANMTVAPGVTLLFGSGAQLRVFGSTFAGYSTDPDWNSEPLHSLHFERPMSLVLSIKRAGRAPRPSKNPAPRSGHAATGGHPTRSGQGRITSTGLLLALLAFGLSGCGGGSTDPGQRVVLGGIIQVIDAGNALRGGPTLVEIEGLVNGRSVGATRIPQGGQAELNMVILLEETRSGQV